MKSLCTLLFFMLVSNGYAQGFLDSIAAIPESLVQVNGLKSNSYNSNGYGLEVANIYTINPSKPTLYPPIIVEGLIIVYQVSEESKSRTDYEKSRSSQFVFYQGKLRSAILYFDSSLTSGVRKKLLKACGKSLERGGSNTIECDYFDNAKYHLSFLPQGTFSSIPSMSQLEIEIKSVDKKLMADYKSSHKEDSEPQSRKGHGNSSFIPDIVHCLRLMQQSTTIKSFESLLPSFEEDDAKTIEADVTSISYEYEFAYKGTKVSLTASLNASTKTIKSVYVAFTNSSGFLVFEEDAQIKSLGFSYNLKWNYIEEKFQLFPGDKKFDVYKNPTGAYLRIYPSGNFSLDK